MDYGTSINVAGDPNGVPQDLYGAGGVSAIYTITQMVWMAQAISTNAVGIHWASLYSQPDWNDQKTLRMMVSLKFRLLPEV